MSDLVADEVDMLAEESVELALFYVTEHWKCISLYVTNGEQTVQTPVSVGNREEFHNTAVGKASLAYKPQEEAERYLDDHGLTEVTKNTITDREAFFNELEKIRDRGLAYHREEAIHGLVGMGAPVRRHDGSVAGALSIIDPGSRMDDDRLADYTEMIKRSANIIEINSTSL